MKAQLKRAWWILNGITAPHPLGIEHVNTATSACANGRHWNCGLKVINFRGGCICTCPCHGSDI